MPNRSSSQTDDTATVGNVGGEGRQQFGRRMKVTELNVVYEGWVLKKKRKKMQGYAKRYLILTKEGLLTYSISPDKLTRDSIEIPHASVTSSKRHGTLHVDSGSSVFHIKMLSPQDFEAWRSHLRSFIPDAAPGSEKRIFVSANNGTELQSVDLSHLFKSSENVGNLIQTIQQKVGQMREDKIDQPSFVGLVMPRASDNDSPLQSLSTLLDQLRAEHENLQHALDSKIPQATGPDGTMNSLSSRKNNNVIGNQHRLSVSSFHTTNTDEAVYYDADAAAGFDEESSRADESSGAEGSEDDEDDSGDDSPGGPARGVDEKKTDFRKELPATVSGDEVSLFSMLKKNVGKDLSTISFPVSFNCPLSLLQAAAEEYEYAPELLEKASKTQDWIERICLVGAFSVSGYASTKLRASRKPFNPLLGETFECVREDKRLRFIAEKVVHQPPIVAVYAEGKGWQCEGWSSMKNKFWGKSLELIPEGQTRLEFDDGDVYSFQKPSSFMRNLLAGNKYLEHVGELTVTNENTGAKLVVEFKEGNMWGGQSSRNQVVGTVYDEKSKKVGQVKGKWSDNLAIDKGDDNFQMLWEATEMPKDAEKYYGFTYFAMSLNELTKDLDGVIPKTDSRLRPDQRAFEEGNVDKAEELKQKLEGEQRQRRKEGKAPTPRWFHKEEGDEPEWKYGAKDGTNYFKARAKVTKSDSAGDEKGEKEPKGQGQDAWEGVPDIFAM